MYCRWRCRCKPVGKQCQWGWGAFLSFAVLQARYIFDESHSLALECKVGGKFHEKGNTFLRLIANKYHEGNMKRTLKRELKESAFAEQKANRMNSAWLDYCAVCFVYLCCIRVQWFFPWMPALFLQIVIFVHEWKYVCGYWIACVCGDLWFTYMCVLCWWLVSLRVVFILEHGKPWLHICWQHVSAWPVLKHGPRSLTDVQICGCANLFVKWKYWLGYLHQQPTNWQTEVWAWAYLLGPERWWTMPEQNEFRGNSDGGSYRYWRANRSSYLGIGAKD